MFILRVSRLSRNSEASALKLRGSLEKLFHGSFDTDNPFYDGLTPMCGWRFECI